MKLVELRLKRFLTYDDFVYRFEERPLLVQGLNLTEDDQKSNGTGKSGLQTGIEFCITASNSRDVRDNELITYGENSAEVELFASCNIRKEEIHIKWIIKLKGSNKLELRIKKFDEEWLPDEEDGTNKHDVSFSNVNDGKKVVLAWFAISKEDLFNYYIINTSRFKSFFKSSNREKTELINRFSDASIIEGLEDIDTEELEADFRNAERKVNNTEGKIELIDDQVLTECERDFKKELAEALEEVQEEVDEIEESINDTEKLSTTTKELINTINSIDIKKEQKLISGSKVEKGILEDSLEIAQYEFNGAKKLVDEAQALVDKFVSTDFKNKREAFEGDIHIDECAQEEYEESVEEHEGVIKTIDKKLNEISIKLSGAITCPKCEHEFILDDDLETLKTKEGKINILRGKFDQKRKNFQNTVDTIKAGIKKIETKISNINKEEALENTEKNKLITSLQEINKTLTKKEKDYSDILGDIKDCDGDIKDYERNVITLKSNITSHKDSIKNYKKRVENYKDEITNLTSQSKKLSIGNSDENISTLKSQRKLLKIELRGQKKHVEELGNSIYEKNQWKKQFKQFKTYLANQSLELIQYHCNRYLSDMNSDMRVVMEGYRMLADGSIKEEMTAKVIRGTERTFSSFSGGEKGRLLFASILANRHMINSTHPYGGLDFLSIDEVFEGVDSIGLKHLINSAKTLEIPVMIITHVTDEEVNSDRILIVKEFGISTVKDEDWINNHFIQGRI